MEGDAIKMEKMVKIDDFYPRPHMEGDMSVGMIFDMMIISTHALTWRATAR